ncbi:MAG: HDOD domain-containing protein [Opitutaceae bacterium]|nr:HDOD domain-containing protein [Opitutaceae bacterium]
MTSITDASPQEARARQTLERVASGLAGGGVAGMAEIVKLVEALAANASHITVSEMAELIEKDVVVCSKVISAANTLGYNPSGVEVSSISQAIHVIGFSKIRMLAMSLLLMENAERRLSASAQRETATLALTSGMMAQAWAEGQGRGDAEQAFLCASLRNFGRLLMTALMADDYRLAQTQAVALGDPEAGYRAVFGVTPLELGYELLKSANLPESLLLGLRQFSPQMLEAAVLDPSTELLVASEFAVRLSQLVLQPELSPTAYADQSRALLRQFGKHLNLDAESLRSVFERAEQRMSAFGQAFGLQAMSRGVTAKVAARRQGKAAPSSELRPADGPELARADTAVGTKPAQAGEPALAGAEAPPKGALGEAEVASPVAAPAELPAERRPLIEVLHETVAKCAELLGQPVVSEEMLATPIAAALREGWGADEVVILLERGKGTFATAAGAGNRWREFRNKIGFRREERNVLGVSTARCEPVLIHDASDPKIDPYLPVWLKSGLQLYSCIIIPGGAAPTAHSVVFAGWRVRQKVQLSPEETRSIRALLGMIITARRLSGK